MRQGELLALDWQHIDLENKTLKVERSVKEVYVYEDENTKHIETVFQIPKTANSIRTIPLSDSIIEMLKNVKNKEGLLFTDDEGGVLKAKNVAYQWRKILKECDINHKKFHSIRHTFASILLKKRR